MTQWSICNNEREHKSCDEMFENKDISRGTHILLLDKTENTQLETQHQHRTRSPDRLVTSKAFVCQEELETCFHVIVNLLFVRFAITTFILQHYEGKTNFLELCTVTDSKQLKQITY